jgi:hypothetical protein
MSAAMSNFARPMVLGLAMMTMGMFAATAEPAAEIPAKFHGNGCNLKYTYARAPKDYAADCINARQGHKEGEGHNDDNFIRITKSSVAGVEWVCDVKTAKTAGETEFTFDADCGGEGDATYASTVTLLLRPGRLVIVDQAIEGRHLTDIYRLRDDLK